MDVEAEGPRGEDGSGEEGPDVPTAEDLDFLNDGNPEEDKEPEEPSVEKT